MTSPAGPKSTTSPPTPRIAAPSRTTSASPVTMASACTARMWLSRGGREPMVVHVASGRAEARRTDSAFDGVGVHAEGRPGAGDHVLLEHHATEVVRAETEGDLADLGPLRDPRSPDVVDVVEQDARERLLAQVEHRPVI